MWPRADTVVWLDFPKRTVMRRVTARTVKRAVLRQELWNGNREPRAALLPWRDSSMIWWSWTTFEKRRRIYSEAMENPRWGHLDFVRLRSPSEAADWLQGGAAPPGPFSTRSAPSEAG